MRIMFGFHSSAPTRNTSVDVFTLVTCSLLMKCKKKKTMKNVHISNMFGVKLHLYTGHCAK